MRKSNPKLIYFAFLLITLFFNAVLAAPAPAPQNSNEIGGRQPQEITIRISATESVFAVARILDPQLPTLIMLPGIFRGFLKNEPFLEILNRRKLNWIAFHTSRHPESLLKGGHNPWFRQVTSSSLAQEVLVVKRALKIQNPIVVSLSYTSSVVPHLNPQEFPVVIETAPMGHALENNPPAPYYDAWKNWIGMFPIWGGVIIQSQEYWAYRGYWLQQAQELSQTHTHYAPKVQTIAEGLAQLAFASRGFDLREQNFSKGPQRFWILGQKENKARKAIQVEAVQLYEKQTGFTNSAIVIEGAAHVIPNEQPEAYVKTLSELVRKMTQ